MATPSSAYGTLLKKETVPGEGTFATIARIEEIDPPELLAEVDEVTSHNGDGYRERIPTLKDISEFSLTVTYDSTDTTHAGLVSDLDSQTLRNWQIAFPDAGDEVWEFAGYVTRFKPTTPKDGALRAEVTISPTGGPTIT